MGLDPDSAAQSAPVPAGRVGVVDIGSNSIRLVVYEGHSRAPIPVFNEKVLCGLGRGLAAGGRLDPDGARLALDNLARFAELARVMKLVHLDVVATAAVRDADDGAEFARRVERRAGLAVRVLSGSEEAEYSAQGVISGIPDADGLMGDIGAGSLELARLDAGRPGRHATLPLGPFRIGVPRGAAGRAETAARIDARLASQDWLGQAEGRALYLVGGNWRALARIHMAQRDYPLRMIHQYALPRPEAASLAAVVAGLGGSSLARMKAVARRRRDTLPAAALVLERLLRAARPREVVFSADGVREGILYSHLSASVRARDPLIEGCASFAERIGGSSAYGRALADWLAPLFADESADARRLRRAACLLAETAWREHPDHRAEQAFQRVLRLQVVGIDHPGRVYLALAVAARHESARSETGFAGALRLLDGARRREARRVGLALRLADSLSAGEADALARTTLAVSAGRLLLGFRPGAENLLGEAVERRLRSLAGAMGLDPVLGPRSTA